ncbi:MAG: acyl-CoA dehydrogenase family protein, partial [Rhodococcus sp. (in: high G+C Gram-positive bacteria)]
MTLATSEDQRDVQRSIRSWIASVEPIGTLRADPESGWRTHWQDLADLGIFSVAVPESAGGVGGTVADLAVMVESAGSGLVAGPVWTSALAATLVGRGVGRGRSAEDLCSGRTPCAVALSDT